VESKGRGGRTVVRPVMISHAFGLGPLDGALPWSFYAGGAYIGFYVCGSTVARHRAEVPQT